MRVRSAARGGATAPCRRCLSWRAGAILLACLVALGGSACAPSLRGTVSAERLQGVLERDMVRVDGDELPPVLLERLARYRVVVVGEYHGIAEHDAFVGELVTALHDRGVRMLLLEFPQAYDWLLDGYARGFVDTPGEAAQRTYGAMLDSVRARNASLPPEEHLRVFAIDVNHGDDDFLPPFRGIAHQLGQPPQLMDAAAAIEAGEAPGAVLVGLQATLVAEADALEEDWGEAAYLAVLDMVEAERRSLEVRAEPAGRRRDEAREAVMKALVDRQLARTGGAALVNVGRYHAQKTSRDGTVDVWLGEYLTRSSPHAQGETFVLVVAPASGERHVGDAVQTFDVAVDSPPNELFRLMHAIAGDAPAFLALDDELFANERVVVNYQPRIDTAPPAKAFDGFVLLPEVRPATR